MSVADRGRLVFEEYADLDRHLAGVWRRERARCAAARWGWCLLTGVARAGLSMVGISPYEVHNVGSYGDSRVSATTDARTGEGDR